MSILADLPGVEKVLAVLEEVQRRKFRLHLLSSCLAWLAISAGTIMVVSVAGAWDPPVLVKHLLRIVLFAVPVLSACWLALKLLKKEDLERLAVFVEGRFGGLGNGLINALQLARDWRFWAEPALVRRAVYEASQAAYEVDPIHAVPMTPLVRAGAAAAGSVVVLALVVLIWPNGVKYGLGSVLRPASALPRVGAVPIESVEPGDAVALLGEPFTVTARLENPAARPVEVDLVMSSPSGRQQLRMVPYGPGRRVFRYTIQAVGGPFRYYVEAGRSRSRSYQVQVRPRISVQRLEHVYHYPGYTGLGTRAVQEAAGSIEAPLGTRVDVSVVLADPVAQAWIEQGPDRRLAMTASLASRRFSATLAISKDAQYAIVLAEAGGKVLARLPAPPAGDGTIELNGLNLAAGREGFWPIRAVPDAEPSVAMIQPAADMVVPLGRSVTVVAEARDDYGLRELSIWMEPAANDGSVKPRRIALLDRFDDRRKATAAGSLLIDPKRYGTGDVLEVWAEAEDNRRLGDRLGPQRSVSKRIRLTVQDLRETERQRLERLEQLRRRLAEILKLQVKTKADLVEAKHLRAEADLRRKLQDVAAGQRRVRSQLVDVAQNFPREAAVVEILGVVASLAAGEAEQALLAAETMLQRPTANQVRLQSESLLTLQDRIIEVLSSLIGIINNLKQTAPGETPAGRGGDIPVDVLRKLRDLHERLQQFIDEQRRAVETTASTAKRPVDDFTEEDLANLKQLAALEEQWDKFLEEAISDFSNIAEQDFSNPALLAELVEIRSDVKMAKDALNEKAVEIAVALEESGLELAEELTTHLEKWLPDTPDRQKWSMEEPIEGQTEVPMAELPKELEDIIGELMEDEEDLFDEIEDVSSKWTDSLDKGAGWDAMDGPISNMSAQGVTGNRLPNTSEIAGRSGEGRQGKAVGEMVEQTATGKGGRRTPTRLSPDPFQAGQVRDSSQEPPGGATGGGKLSGVGGEGLEGPVPAPLQQRLQRLAQEQAAIRNKAEKIDLKYRLSRYPGLSEFSQLITLMRRTEQDLRAYRYQNALRRRRVLVSSLGSAQAIVAGRMQARFDTSSQLPKAALEEIESIDVSTFPPVYADLLKKYYQTLSRGGSAGSR